MARQRLGGRRRSARCSRTSLVTALQYGMRRPIARRALSKLCRECCQGLYRSSGGCDRDEPTVELDDGGAIEGPGPGPVAVRGLDRGLELEPSEGRAECVRAPQERLAFGDERAVPQRGVLFVEGRPRRARLVRVPVTVRA